MAELWPGLVAGMLDCSSLNKWDSQVSLCKSGLLSGCFLIVGRESLML